MIETIVLIGFSVILLSTLIGVIRNVPGWTRRGRRFSKKWNEWTAPK